MNGDTLYLNADASPMGLVPLSTRCWQEAIRMTWSGVAEAVHYYDDWVVHSPRQTWRVPSVIIARSYRKPRKHLGYTKELLYLRDRYTCQYCLQEFSSCGLTQDHVLPRSRGGPKNWTNMVAACYACNSNRGDNQRIQPNRTPWKPTYWELVECRKKYPLYVPDESWLPYIDWDPDLIRIGERKN